MYPPCLYLSCCGPVTQRRRPSRGLQPTCCSVALSGPCTRGSQKNLREGPIESRGYTQTPRARGGRHSMNICWPKYWMGRSQQPCHMGSLRLRHPHFSWKHREGHWPDARGANAELPPSYPASQGRHLEPASPPVQPPPPARALAGHRTPEQ